MGNLLDCFKSRSRENSQKHPKSQISNNQAFQMEFQVKDNKPIKKETCYNQMEVSQSPVQETKSDSHTSFLSDSDNDEDEFFDHLDRSIVSQIPQNNQQREEIYQEFNIIEPNSSGFSKQQKKQMKSDFHCNNLILEEEEENFENQDRQYSQVNIEIPFIPSNYLLHLEFLNIVNNLPLEQKEDQFISQMNDVIIQIEPETIIDDESVGSEINEIFYNCQKCNQDIKENTYQLQCFHCYHKKCLTELAEDQIKQDRIQIVCLCQSKIQSSILRQIMLPEDLLQKYFSNQYEAIDKNIF